MSGKTIQKELTTSAAEMYTATGNAQIVAIDLTNDTASGETATVYKIKSGDTYSSAATASVIYSVTAAAVGGGGGHTQATFLLSHFLERGDSVYAKASNGSAIVLTISVAEVG